MRSYALWDSLVFLIAWVGFYIGLVHTHDIWTHRQILLRSWLYAVLAALIVGVVGWIFITVFD